MSFLRARGRMLLQIFKENYKFPRVNLTAYIQSIYNVYN